MTAKVSDAERRAEYEQMAADEEHEREALEWCEALIGDAFSEETSSEEAAAGQSELGSWSAADLATVTEAIAECRQIEFNEW